jgi:hypothetical protein
MKRLATMLVAACALMLALVAIAPDDASAGWRRGYGYYGPGVGVYVGPGYGSYGYGYRPRYTAAITHTPITPIGVAAIGGGAGATSA